MKKVLFLTSNIFPCRSGDAIYAAGVVERLANNNQVDVLTYGKYASIIEDENYKRLKDKISNITIINYKHDKVYSKLLILKYGHMLHKYTREMKKELKSMLASNKYDVLVIDHLRMYSLYKETKNLINLKQTRIILLAQNVEYLNMRESTQFTTPAYRKIIFKLLNYNLKNFEKQAVQEVDSLWGLSQEDLNVLKSLAKANEKPTKTVTPYFSYKRVKNETDILNNTYNLLFLGSMSWYPNVAGAIYFIEKIFSKLLNMDNRYKLYIVGNNPHPEILKYQSDKIIVTGEVPSVDYIKNSDFVIIPNKLGSGVKIKVLESVLKGIPIIAFKESLVGYPIELFSDGLCVSSDFDFADSIIKLNKNPEIKRELIKKISTEFQNNTHEILL